MRARRRARLLALLAGGALLSGCDRLPGRPDPADRYRPPAEVTDFATLYAENCSGCHGAEGRLGPARPLADPVYLALVDEERLGRVVAGGVPGTAMPAFAADRGGQLTDAQVEILARGVFERWADPASARGAALPPYAAPTAGDPARGERAYARFCARCHGPDGRGGEDGGSVVAPSFLALVSDQMLRTSVIAGRPDLSMPDWRTASDERAMTPQEISDTVAWMAAQRTPVPGRPVPMGER